LVSGNEGRNFSQKLKHLKIKVMEEMAEHLINSSMQRSGLMAVVVGVLMTTKDEATLETTCNILEGVINQLPVNDEIEERAKREIEDARARLAVMNLVNEN
jgi:hypothetical protein